MAFTPHSLGGPYYSGGSTGRKMWTYHTDDDLATITAANYLTNAGVGENQDHHDVGSTLGMDAGDIFTVVQIGGGDTLSAPSSSASGNGGATDFNNVVGITTMTISGINTASGAGTLIATAVA